MTPWKTLSAVAVAAAAGFAVGSSLGDFRAADADVFNGVSMALVALIQLGLLIWLFMEYSEFSAPVKVFYPAGAVILPYLFIIVMGVVIIFVLAGFLLFGLLLTWLLS